MTTRSLTRRFIYFGLALSGAFFLSTAQISFHWPAEAMAQKGDKLWTEKSDAERAQSSGGLDVAALNKSFVDLAKKLSPAVVNIYTKTRIGGGGRGHGQMGPDDIFKYFFGNPFDDFQQPPQEAQALGSGFVINADGLVVTNNHVVRGLQGKTADSIMLKFIDDSEKSPGHEAKLLGYDEGTDVAVLKLKNPKKDLAWAPLGNSDKTQVGEWVVAIGNPYGHTHTVTKGIVSALGRAIEQSRADFIQTDASINPGNSGGPLFNLYGEVIGINSAIDPRAQGIGFAIPINTAKNIIRQIIEKGEVSLGWIGVTIGEVTPQISKSLGLGDVDGVIIQDVFRGEPADKAGLRSYDIVTEVAGRKISTGRDFIVTIGNLPIGQATNFKIIRDGKTMTLAVKVAKRKSQEELAKNFGGQEERGSRGRGGPKAGPSNRTIISKTGMILAELSPEVRRQLDLSGTVTGVVIQRVLPGSPATAAMLQAGDVITEINRKTVHSVKEAETALSAKLDSMLLKIQRRSASIIVFLDLNARSGDDGGPDDGSGGFPGGGDDDQ